MKILDLSSTLLGDVALEQLLDVFGGLHLWLVSPASFESCRDECIGMGPAANALRRGREMSPGETANITCLNFDSNGIDDEGVFFLASACMRCELLRELHMRHDRLTKKGAATLGSAVLATPFLQCLNLHSNLLGDEGLRALLQYAKY
ncbi:putative leucine-rich repeat protein (LRRP) [Trypanosoma rangeli]|uniref:Putative leucine-rich repeat protein (LRRP) n=1 Tax=Trypanosoma rangeli TaxID=5698 RepID=A0A422NIN0_TRYRA|nr:putative leucine-rich repeat protein (LRRP) [Trypanosoma rangeli]RNF05309.1 putative leucine-rich repeat protein (LRRP) [Trypanosoma rangeli]|eukprot:RNF05309.1 putative leucine-rich repeat protein (LRRP) [Trypanosoma rangeli]